MKYMLIMQATAQDVTGIQNWPHEAIVAHVEFMRDLNENYFRPGEFIDAQGLAGPDAVRVVRADIDGEPIVTDGPFPETKEFLAGWWLLESDEKRAYEIAAHISAAPGPDGKPLNFEILMHPIGEAPA